MKKIIFIAAISTLFISACTKSAVESNNGSNINSVVDASMEFFFGYITFPTN